MCSLRSQPSFGRGRNRDTMKKRLGMKTLVAVRYGIPRESVDGCSRGKSAPKILRKKLWWADVWARSQWAQAHRLRHGGRCSETPRGKVTTVSEDLLTGEHVDSDAHRAHTRPVDTWKKTEWPFPFQSKESPCTIRTTLVSQKWKEVFRGQNFGSIEEHWNHPRQWPEGNTTPCLNLWEEPIAQSA